MQQLKKDNLNFYPVGRAISIDGIYPKDSASQASAALLAKLETIGNKINEEVKPNKSAHPFNNICDRHICGVVINT